MNLSALKYYSVFSTLVFAFLSLTMRGVWTFSLPIYVFVFIPVLEFLLPANGGNLSKEEEAAALKKKTYDYLLYAMVPTLYGITIFFMFSIQEIGLSSLDIAGRVLTLGIMLVTIGFNVGHELGHRKSKQEQFMAKALLLLSFQMHFIIEHNRGHHKKVSTDEDPASSRYGEMLYVFWIRSWVMSYISAWKLEGERLKRRKIKMLSMHNEMIRFEIIQLLLLLVVYLLFGGYVTLLFFSAAVISKLFFETINYIEHYGLRRKKKAVGYEKVLPVHSWNANQDVGRIMLFELTRHSDHHYKASRKYQILKHYEEVPQMPAGYPAMLLLSFFPPLWFFVMHRQIKRFKREYKSAADLA